jgi:hypothetical protein
MVSLNNAENHIYALKNVQQQTGLDWSKLEITPMIGINDDGISNTSLETMKEVSEFAAKKGMMTVSYWSAGRDNPSLSKLADSISSGAIDETPYQKASTDFAKMTINAFLGKGSAPDMDPIPPSTVTPGSKPGDYFVPNDNSEKVFLKPEPYPPPLYAHF